MEFDPEATRIAAERCSEVYTADLDAPDALAPARASAPYDVLFAAAVLEHLKYPERLLHDVQALLKRGSRSTSVASQSATISRRRARRRGWAAL